MACNKKPATSEHPHTSNRANWDIASEAALIQFLLKHKSNASDGINFKAPTFKVAAVHLNHLTSFDSKSTIKGGAKNSASCKNKWARVCALVQVFRVTS